MAETKILGYIISVIGLVVIALSKQIAVMLSFLGAKAFVITAMAGVVFIILGVALVLMQGSSSSGTIKQAAEEVPIYEGTGKNRKIVGYQKANKK